MDENQVNTRRGRRWAKWGLLVGAPIMAAGLFLAPRAFAGPGRHGCHGFMHQGADNVQEMRAHMKRPLSRMFKRIDATEGQRAAIEGIVDEAATEMFALKDQGRGLHEKLEQEVLKQTIDQAKVNALSAEIEATVGQATRIGVETMGRVASELRLEQRQKIAKHLSHFRH